MKVIKFGGTSVGTAQKLKDAAAIINSYQQKDKVIVVISAIGGITNKLISAIDEAVHGSNKYSEIFWEITTVHHNYIDELFAADKRESVKSEVDSTLARLKEKLDGVRLLHHAAPKIIDQIISFGELLSQKILAEYLKSDGLNAVVYNAADFIKTDSNFGDANINFEITNEKVRIVFIGQKRNEIAVVNGFTGSNKYGDITTLGRSGSDYTATIIGAALKVDSVDIWTDVDGILNADPRLVPSAETIDEISYEQTIELSNLGAKVIFPKSLLPVKAENIPVKVLNSFNPDFAGTTITDETQNTSKDVLVVTSLDNVSIVTISNLPLYNSLEVVSRIYNLLSSAQLNVVSTNFNHHLRVLSLIINQKDLDKTINLIESEFQFVPESDFIKNIEIRNDAGIVSLLLNNSANVRQIINSASSSLSDLNISYRFINNFGSNTVQLAVKNSDIGKIVSNLHGVFFGTNQKANVA
ncbi:MAG: aspartate kinase [Ignavibacteriales bacterium]|nr:aspartate kinase [Ignavibacteriales bacterium]